MWKAGTIIVCVDDSPSAMYKQVVMGNGIHRGEMYTVRSYAESFPFFRDYFTMDQQTGVWLNEIRRNHGFVADYLEPWFNRNNIDPHDMPYGAKRFRLLESAHDEREVSLSIKRK